MPLLVDTGILYALADRTDAWHQKSRRYLQSVRERLLAPVSILPEVCYLLRERIGEQAELAFVTSIAAGEVAVEDLKASDWTRIAQLMQQYDAIGMVDASVIAVAERLKIDTLATTDHRHFTMVRPAHVERLTLVPRLTP